MESWESSTRAPASFDYPLHSTSLPVNSRRQSRSAFFSPPDLERFRLASGSSVPPYNVSAGARGIKLPSLCAVLPPDIEEQRYIPRPEHSYFDAVPPSFPNPPSIPTPSALKTHLRTHSQEKPFVCPVDWCRRAFSVYSNMVRHQRLCNHPTPIEPAVVLSPSWLQSSPPVPPLPPTYALPPHEALAGDDDFAYGDASPISGASEGDTWSPSELVESESTSSFSSGRPHGLLDLLSDVASLSTAPRY